MVDGLGGAVAKALAFGVVIIIIISVGLGMLLTLGISKCSHYEIKIEKKVEDKPEK
jgi:hypothetical protein